MKEQSGMEWWPHDHKEMKFEDGNEDYGDQALDDGSTRELLKRKNMNLDSYNCVLCLQGAEESLQHLFFHCSFAQCC